jgi:phosphoribosylformimino-5-aminoimidazole carboxamide ribotide isomerase
MFEIIPAIDLMGGKCVRLTQGSYNEKTEYSSSPVEAAKSFEAAGLTRLHLVDLDGAKSGRPQNLEALTAIAKATNLSIDYSGGLRREEHVKAAFGSGADMISIGSLAVKDKELFLGWVEQFGAERILLSADVKDGNVAISGWTQDSGMELFEFLTTYYEHGIRRVICTDISKDGLLEGSSLDLYKKIIEKFPDINLIASGGVTAIDELTQLSQIGIAGAIVGKAIYEGKLTLKELGAFAC